MLPPNRADLRDERGSVLLIEPWQLLELTLEAALWTPLIFIAIRWGGLLSELRRKDFDLSKLPHCN
jgi:hypothetical protein